MNRRIDLHVHSNLSEDGDLSIADLFDLARRSGLAAIAITDHDSVDSIDAAGRTAPGTGVEHVPGVEITTVLDADGSQQHILGFYVDNRDPRLLAALETIRGCRKRIATRRIEALQRVGFTLDRERVWKAAGERAPAATAISLEVLENPANADDPRLVEYFSGPKKDNRLMIFYREYLAEGAPAHVPFESIPTSKGIEVIIGAGGVPVLAHPVFVKDGARLDVIRDYGIAGIEAISSYHDASKIRYYLDYASKNNLLVTAGSDYHGPTTKPKVKLGGIEGNGYELLEGIRNARGKRS